LSCESVLVLELMLMFVLVLVGVPALYTGGDRVGERSDGSIMVCSTGDDVTLVLRSRPRRAISDDAA